MRFFAPVARGLEGVLGEELRAMGVRGVRPATAGASFEGDIDAGYRACLWSRVASRVLMPIARFSASDPDALYEGARAIAWEEHLALASTFAIDATVRDSRITHSGFAGLRVKDAIADRFRERTGERPSVDTVAPDLRVNVALRRDTATVSIDLAGDPLHRRGYRRSGVQAAAPLKETLAAGMLALAGWPDIAAAGGALLDPMCGSGTLPIEAALMAADIAPGMRRTRWGFSGWLGHDAAAWERLLDEAMERAERGVASLPPIAGSDIDADAVAIARACAARAGLADAIELSVRDVREAVPPASSPRGLLVVNPPYGERLGGELEPLYAALGERARRVLGGWRLALLSSEEALEARVGLPASARIELMNGRIPVRLSVSEVPRREADGELALDEHTRMFANRLRKRARHLAKWARREGVTCYRVYDADLPEYALAIDVFEGRWVHVAEYAPPADVDPDLAAARLSAAVGAIPAVLGVRAEDVFLKVRRRQKGAQQYGRAQTAGVLREVHEGKATFLVDLGGYLDTGLFLDHRPLRARIMAEAAGKRFLNVFAYTGTVSVAAALGGARQVTTVDLSQTYLAWARRNLEANGFAGARYEYVHADARHWPKAVRSRRFDLVFLDPPSFSNSKRMDGVLDVQRDHVALIIAYADLLAEGGTLYFSTNLRSFSLDADLLLAAGLTVEDITPSTIPPDFERDPRVHRCYVVRAAR